MATQSQCRWVCTRPPYYDPFSSTSSASCSSSSSYNPSFLRSFNTAFVKRHCFKGCSLGNSSSTSTPISVPRPRKPVKLECSGSGGEEFGGNPKNEASLEFLNQIQTQKRETLSLRPLVGKRSLWRRVLFASRKVRSIILLNVITVVYASNIPVVKEVQEIMNPAAFTMVRFAASAIPFIPFVLRDRDDTQTRNAGMELGFWVSLGYLTQALGLLTSDAGRASFLSMFTVIVVPLLDGMLGAIVPVRTWFGALMSIVGVGLLECSGSPPCIGDLLNFLSAVFFGIHMLRTEHISRTINKEKFLPLLGFEICVVALSSTLWYLVGGCFGGVQDPWPLSWTWSMLRDWMVDFPWIPAIYTGIFSTGLCLWIEMAAMRDVSATETAIIYGLEPVWGAAFAWFLLGERWGVAGWIGAVLVLGGSLTVQISGASTSPSESSKGPKESKKRGSLLVADEQNGLSTSPVIVRSRKDDSDLL